MNNQNINNSPHHDRVEEQTLDAEQMLRGAAEQYLRALQSGDDWALAVTEARVRLATAACIWADKTAASRDHPTPEEQD